MSSETDDIREVESRVRDGPILFDFAWQCQKLLRFHNVYWLKIALTSVARVTKRRLHTIRERP